jgi:hypothetical protein
MSEKPWTESERPYIEQPSEKRDDLANGLICFIDPTRECGPDCMSFTTTPAESPGLNDQQKRCTILVSLERVGRYLGVFVKLFKEVPRG